MNSRGIRVGLGLLGVFFFIAVGLIVSAQNRPGPIPPTLVVAPDVSDRFLTHVTTDKPIYRTGEKVYVRGILLRAHSHTPGATGAARYEIKGPKGDTVASGISPIADSIVGFSWDVPATQAGGEYTARIFHPDSGDVPGERKFDIRVYRAPRLKSQIVFVRDGYGPGDTVAANLHVDRAEGGVPAGAKVSVIARVDGADVWKGQVVVDALGNTSASFRLPATIERGEGSIAMVIEDGGIIETATKTIPILLQTLDLAIYPEGGDLVAGLQNRVYIEGRTPAQKPADISGVIVNAAGREIASVRTEHDGRGRFTFVPARGEKYSLRVTAPAGIRTTFPLPAVKPSGVILASTSDIALRQKDVGLRVAATTDGEYGVALSQRGRELAFKLVALKASEPADVFFTLPRGVDGVIVATVYDNRNTPRSERLIFRQPDTRLKVQVTADRTDYVPGDKVKLQIMTTDDTGKPVGAVVGLTVTDSSVLEMIDKRDQTGRLPVMVLLESEVKNLADAHVYLDETNPKAPLATDLLLGTQGWRRFLTLDTTKFVESYGDRARRILVGWRGLPSATTTGVVTDATGAVIPGVRVRATAIESGLVTSVFTNESGVFNISKLLPGQYTLSASLPGFQTQTLTGIRLKDDSSYRYNFRLPVAAVNTAVEVSIDAAVLQRADAFSDIVRDRLVKAEERGAIAMMRPAAIPAPPPPPPPILAPRELEADKDRGVREQFAPLGNLVAADAKKQAFGFAEMRQEAVAYMTVREYAHALRPGWTEQSRVDFSETVYWNAGIKTDATTGVATVSFNLSDSVTSFRVLSDAFGFNGALGSGSSEIESVRPFYIEPKLPLQVTSGDVIHLPIGLINGLRRPLSSTEIHLTTVNGIKFAAFEGSHTLGARERARRLLRLDVGQGFSGTADLTISANAGPYRDMVSRKLIVQPLGFPFERSSGGVLEPNASRSFEFTLPAQIVRGSVSTSVMVYPTPLASMNEALQSLLHEPYGCFEQTSSTSYPMVMAQQYFLTHTGIEPAVVEKARGLLESSYKRLTGFETRSKGYEWFGAAPGHEALTAYGLMQFSDMSHVRSVDKEMLDRTRGWLLSRRDGKGGFLRSDKALDTFGGAPADTTNAYITWALIESGEKGLDKEVAAVKVSAAATQDSYVIALAANILHATGDQAGARQLMERLSKSQDANGSVKGAVTSITRSGGDALAIETTALSALVWMRDPLYAANVEKGLRWVAESNKSGRYGSTQSTILALRAIVAYDSAHARPKTPGRFVLTVDGRTVGAPVAFTANTQGAIVLPEFASELGPGKHTVVLKMEDGSKMPFAMSVKYHSTLPDSSEKAQIGIQVAFKDRQVQEGALAEAVVSIANKSDQVIPTPVAIVGIPGGLEVRHDQLKELVKAGRIDAYEVNGQEVVLYWRYLQANDKFDLPLSLVAAIPGSYTAPASRAYLYYTDEYKSWAPGVTVNITPR